MLRQFHVYIVSSWRSRKLGKRAEKRDVSRVKLERERHQGNTEKFPLLIYIRTGPTIESVNVIFLLVVNPDLFLCYPSSFGNFYFYEFT